MTDALRTDFAPLLDIRRAVVVGASDRGPGYTLLENLSTYGGEVIGVHPKREEAAGHRCVPSIHDVPFKPDVVAMALGPRTIVPALDEAIAAGHRVFSIPGLGAEAAGEEGDIARAAVRERLGAYRLAEDDDTLEGTLLGGLAQQDAANFGRAGESELAHQRVLAELLADLGGALRGDHRQEALGQPRAVGQQRHGKG